MKRIRWFLASPITQATLRQAVNRMREEEFTPSSTAGFIGQECRTSHIQATYIERFFRSETIVDPFGNSQRFERVEYIHTGFRIALAAPQLEIYDSPRAVAPFLNRLGSLFMDEIQLQPLEVDLVTWLHSLEPKVSSLRVTAAHVGQISLAENVQVKLVFAGTVDVHKYPGLLLGNKAFVFDRLRLVGFFEGLEVRFDLYKEGRATITTGDEELVVLLRESLAQCSSPPT